MLSCFGSTGDMRAQVVGIGGCADAAKALHTCMNKPKKGGNGRVASVSVDVGKKRPRSRIWVIEGEEEGETRECRKRR